VLLLEIVAKVSVFVAIFRTSFALRLEG